MQYINQIKPILFPEKVETWNFSTAYEATKKENLVKITRIALFVFASFTTTAAIALTDKMIIAWPVAGPLVVIMSVAWFTFFASGYLETAHTQGLDQEKRTQLANEEIHRLFFTEPLGNWDPEKSFEMINTLMQVKIFQKEYIEKIKALKCHPEKTLFQTALDNNKKLSFQLDGKVFIRGFYGNEPTKFHIEAHWDGKHENEILIKTSSLTNNPNPEDGLDDQNVLSDDAHPVSDKTTL